MRLKARKKKEEEKNYENRGVEKQSQINKLFSQLWEIVEDKGA